MTTDRSAAAPQPQPLLKRVVNALKVAVVPPVGYQIIQMLRRTMTWRTEGSEHVNRLFAAREAGDPGLLACPAVDDAARHSGA